MFDKIKRSLYFHKLESGIVKGLSEKTILPFEDDLYERLDNVYFCGATISIWLKHLRPKMGPANCEDRSLFITSGFKDSTLVCADLKNLELEHGKNNAWHFFVEYNGWVYDPTSLYKFRKDVYYKLFEPYNIRYYDSSEYKEWKSYKEITNTSLEDLMSNNSKKINFYMGIFGVKALADISSDECFKNDFYKMLDIINYQPCNFNDDISELILNMKK